MNLGFFAKGPDLLPDFGYPSVQYGGWGSTKTKWHTMSAAHNTVVVNEQDHFVANGVTTLSLGTGRFGSCVIQHSGIAGVADGRTPHR